MKIVAPINNLDEAKAVIKEGVDEVYCGLLSEEHKNNYTWASCLNRRPFLSANFSNAKQLKSVVELIHSYGKLISLTVNMHYPPEQFSKAICQIDKALELGIDAVVVSDIGLLYKLKEEKYRDLKIHISALGAVFNSESIKFYKDFGATRIILPRELMLDEIAILALKNMSCELEAFVFSDKCLFIDGFCAFSHILTGARATLQNVFSGCRFFEKSLALLPYTLTRNIEDRCRNYMVSQNPCCVQYKIQQIGQAEELTSKKIENFYKFYAAEMHLKGCGACAIYDLYQTGIGYLKICGRSSLPIKIKIYTIRFIKECLSVLKNGIPNKKEYINKVKILYKKFFKCNCKPINCYY